MSTMPAMASANPAKNTGCSFSSRSSAEDSSAVKNGFTATITPTLLAVV